MNSLTIIVIPFLTQQFPTHETKILIIVFQSESLIQQELTFLIQIFSTRVSLFPFLERYWHLCCFCQIRESCTSPLNWSISNIFATFFLTDCIFIFNNSETVNANHYRSATVRLFQIYTEFSKSILPTHFLVYTPSFITSLLSFLFHLSKRSVFWTSTSKPNQKGTLLVPFFVKSSFFFVKF